MKLFLSALLLLLAAPAAQAEVNLYLFPQVERGRNALVLSDLGRIEGDAGAAGICSIVIDDAIFADGYIDRKEIADLLKTFTGGRVNVYGSGVRVHAAAAVTVNEERRIVVRKGGAVRFQVVSSRVTVGQMGTALQNGAVGEEIPVRLKGTAVSRGRIVNERLVELAL